MSDVVDSAVDMLNETLVDQGQRIEGHDPDRADPECWESTVIRSALAEAVQMVTEASMAYNEEHGEMHDQPHPMDVVAEDNVETVYATSRPWSIPVIVVEVDELPAYLDNPTTENRQVYARRKPGLTEERTYVRVQIRSR